GPASSGRACGGGGRHRPPAAPRPPLGGRSAGGRRPQRPPRPPPGPGPRRPFLRARGDRAGRPSRQDPPGHRHHRRPCPLRRRMRFRGLAVTDDLADPAISSEYSVPEAAVKALKAGADMLYISGPSGDQQAAYVAVLRAVQRKQISKQRLDEAVLRILATK